MKTRLVVFGAGKIAQVVIDSLQNHPEFEVEALIVDHEYIGSPNGIAIPKVTLAEALQQYPPDKFKAFVAVGYQENNALRKKKFEALEKQGYELVSIIGSGADLSSTIKVGRNCFIMKNHLIQPFVSIDDGTFVFNGAIVGHHSKIGGFSWLTSGSSVGGCAEIGHKCFLALGATVVDNIKVGDNCILGANVLVSASIPASSVVVQRPTEICRLNTDQFLKVTKRL